MTPDLKRVASQFIDNSDDLQIKPLGNGLINDTYLVEYSSGSFVLQGINPNVFLRPLDVIANLSVLGRHTQQKDASTVGLRIPHLLLTRHGENYYRDERHRVWRALERIYPAESRESLRHPEEAGQIGYALARFHLLCADIAPAQLHDTLPGFHVTPGYLTQYHSLIAQARSVDNCDEYRKCRDFIEARELDAHALEQAKKRGELKERVIHGDPKLNNFLFEPNSHRIISLIDLDTVKPGLLHYDIGDCIRSCCHDKTNDSFELGRCYIILESYLKETGKIFDSSDYDYLYAAIWLIPFELGLRFFNDYLSGNRYFKIREPRQNLKRALAQFALCGSIERQKTPLQQSIAELKAQLYPSLA